MSDEAHGRANIYQRPRRARGMEGAEVNRLNDERREKIAFYLRLGFSIREVSRALHHHKVTIHAIAVENGIINRDTKAVRSHKEDPRSKQCDNCGVWFVAAREMDRRTRRTKHKFCSHACYGEFRRRSRDSDKCRRCRVSRKDLSGTQRIFSRGYCSRCYGILLQYNFDESLSAIHEATQTLKKELKT